MSEHFERSIVFRLYANGFLEAFDGFDVVVENIGIRFEHGIEEFEIALEVGSEDFDSGAGIAIADGPDGGSPNCSASIG